MGIIVEEIGRYDPYTDTFLKTTTDRIEIGTDGRLHNLSISNTYGLYAKNQEELDKCDYIDKSTKLYTKDEVTAMLTEIRAEMEHVEPHDLGESIVKNACKRVVDIRINALKGDKETGFHCGVEESGGHAYNCNDCPNKCDVYYQWDKETKND